MVFEVGQVALSRCLKVWERYWSISFRGLLRGIGGRTHGKTEFVGRREGGLLLMKTAHPGGAQIIRWDGPWGRLVLQFVGDLVGRAWWLADNCFNYCLG